jgi:hypothetical protein
MTGGGGYAAVAGGGVSPKNPAKNKKPLLENMPKIKRQILAYTLLTP